MKKLLSTVLSLVVGIGCMATLAGCDDSNNTSGPSDADIAKGVIETIVATYDGKDLEVNDNYTVAGQVKYKDGNFYKVEWSSNSANAVVGAMNETTKLVTISITQSTEVIEYKLTATVKVNKATESHSFERKIKALTGIPEGEGTLASPFSVEKAMKIANNLDNSKFYDGVTEKGVDGAKALRVYIKGYVVDPGKTSEQGGKYGGGVQYVSIVDEYAEDKTSQSDDALSVASITYDDTYFTKDNLLTKGEQIIVSGYIERFNNKASVYFITGQNILCAWRSTYVDNKTPDEKVDIALAAIKLSKTTYTEEGTYDLPQSHTNGATYTWSVKTTTDLVSITADNKLKVEKIPTSDTTVELTATVAYEGATSSKTKDVEITIAAPAKTEHAGTLDDPYTVEEALALIGDLTTGDYYGDPTLVHVEGYVVEVGNYTSYGNFEKTYIATSATSTKDSADAIQVYRLTPDGTVLKNADNFIKGAKIVIVGYLQAYTSGPQITYNGGTNPKAAKYEVTDELKAQAALDKVTIPSTLIADHTIPASTIDGVTVKATNSTNSAIAIEEDGAKLKVTRPEATAEDATGKITVTVTCGSVTKTKEFDVTVTKAPSAENPDPVCLATFTLGTDMTGTINEANGDGTSTATYTETVSGYTLNVSNGTNFYKDAYDALGNRCFKLGTSSKAGSFTLAVPSGVKKVVIYVAGYKSSTAKIQINGGAETTISKLSSAGEYEAIEVDTTSLSEISFTTLSGGYRCKINTIEFWG